MDARHCARIVMQNDFRQALDGKSDGCCGERRGTGEFCGAKEPEREIDFVNAIENRSSLQRICAVADFIIAIWLPRGEKGSRVNARGKHLYDAPLGEKFFDLLGTWVEAHIARNHRREFFSLHFLL